MRPSNVSPFDGRLCFPFASRSKKITASKHITEPSDSHLRSLIKALSWRVASLIVTVTVVKVATGDTQTAAVVGTADALIKVVLYYLHERAWIGIRLG